MTHRPTAVTRHRHEKAELAVGEDSSLQVVMAIQNHQDTTRCNERRLTRVDEVATRGNQTMNARCKISK